MSYIELNKEQRDKMQSVLYYMGKTAARESFVDFLDHCDCTLDEWRVIRQHIEDALEIKLYL